MSIEPSLKALSSALSDLVDQRRSQWGDAGGLEFENRFLSPLGEVVSDFQNAAEKFANIVDSALAELDWP
jgi:hypothetical protein